LERAIKIRILDHEYLIRSDEDVETVRTIAQFVDDKFKQVAEEAEGLSERKRAILVAFDIASAFFQVRKERDDLRSDIETRARALNSRLEDLAP
jgi:cell division protein ZapA